jgi:hypothetical protein
MITPLQPTFQKRIKDAFDEITRKQIDPWAMLNSGKPMKVQYFNGKQISYEGIGFEGSPEKVFWTSYIEPFIENIVISEIAEAYKQGSERKVDVSVLLNEVESLLLVSIKSVYSRMAEIDRRLKSRGFPEKICSSSNLI